MPKHYKPDAPRHTRTKPRASRQVSEGAARDAGRKLLVFAGAAIVIVLFGAWLLTRI